MIFRNTNDKIHYYGSFFLSVLFFILSLKFQQYSLIRLIDDPRITMQIALAYLTGFSIAVIAGLLWEALEQWILPRWNDDEYWKGKPEWIRKHFSGDDWDWMDIEYNNKGACWAPLFTIWTKSYTLT